MTIDEAITHAEWCAENSCGECAEDHRQLAEWLRELKALREAEWSYLATINRLKTENENLRRETERNADTMEALVSYIDDSRVDGVCKENAKLRELLRDAAIELYVNGNVTDGATELLFDQMRELGIEVE